MSEALDQHFWEERYKQNNTGWDLGEVSPPIKNYVDQLNDKSIAILIPGCGNAYEAEYLLKQGFNNITLIDLSQTLIQRLKEKLNAYIGNGLSIVHGNFFKLEGKYNLIIEQTFFCALEPALRHKYVEQMYQLLKPKGKLIGLLFNREFEMPGPPFGGNADEYSSLFKRNFEFKTFENCYNSIKPRMGTELFINLVKCEM
ncbi:methyltransferase domain-containing protein [Solitalea koreensis]|uniref:Thiopurine S-methyltransferase (TPMT) n=1 Tax=Solitalea koreensis TaxID=543615 RepID=A0A521CI05_9SPHI|nr:methyltransferase domain-containing protein [Solitalea koreensis]SMO58995.1 Thiopurine S-methyltransferase (TPMT) [Solitalea koreensis]